MWHFIFHLRVTDLKQKQKQKTTHENLCKEVLGMEQRSNMEQITQGLKLVIIKNFWLINNGVNIYNF